MVIWTDMAIQHITEFIDEAREDTVEIAKAYMRDLVDYTAVLETMQKLGKKLKYQIDDYELNQLIYNKHRIIYHIKGNDVVVLSVIHTKLDFGKALRKLRKDNN